MALSSGRDMGLRARRDVFRGNVSQRGMFSLLDDMKAKAGIEKDVPDIRVKSVLAQTSTATVIVGGPCRLYGVRVESGTVISSAQAAAVLDIIANLSDNAIGIARVKCTANKDAEAYFYAGTDGVGIPCVTDLSAAALAAANGSGNPNAADRPTIHVLYGV